MPIGTAFVTFRESNAKALLTGKPIKNATCKQVLRPAGGIAKLTLANTLRLFIRPFHPCESVSQASPQQCKVYIFCNLAIFISAKSLQPALLRSSFYSGLTLSNSQYQELFIFFARMPSSFFAFSSVLFEIPCSSAISKISLL